MAVEAAALEAAAPDLSRIRSTVRDLLLSSPAYQKLEPGDRKRLAQGLVTICHAAVQLQKAQEEGESAVPAPGPLAMTQAAGGGFGAAAQQAPEVARRILNAVSFPRFVTDLINGVFKAMLDSSISQIHAYVELINNVAASAEGFADANIHLDSARQWLAERYPASFELNVEPGETADDGTQLPATVTVVLKAGADAPTPAALAVDLGLGEDETPPPASDPEQLVPLVRKRLAKSRQEVLATLAMLGMQRIVVESGRINAAMRFHIDTHSAAAEDKGSRFESETGIHLAGSYGTGIFNISADIQENIGYVSTQKEQTTEEMNTDLDLSSSVEVNFRGEPVSLDRLATSSQVSAIRANARNPDAEFQAADQARAAREQRQAAAEAARREALNKDLVPHPIGPQPLPKPPQPQPAAEQPAAKQPAAGQQQPQKPPAKGGAGQQTQPQPARQPAAAGGGTDTGGGADRAGQVAARVPGAGIVPANPGG
jgi:hypothetical protein